jgi:hypothetical protein
MSSQWMDGSIGELPEVLPAIAWPCSSTRFTRYQCFFAVCIMLMTLHQMNRLTLLQEKKESLDFHEAMENMVRLFMVIQAET